MLIETKLSAEGEGRWGCPRCKVELELLQAAPCAEPAGAGLRELRLAEAARRSAVNAAPAAPGSAAPPSLSVVTAPTQPGTAEEANEKMNR